MTPWRKFLDHVAVGGALPIEFRWVEYTELYEKIQMRMTVPHVETGETIELVVERHLPHLRTDPQRAAHIRELVHWFYRHEADEQLRINGKRPFMPDHEHEVV